MNAYVLAVQLSGILKQHRVRVMVMMFNAHSVKLWRSAIL